MYALFSDSDGIVTHVSVPENCSVTGTFYCDFVLSAVVNHYQAKHPRAGVQGIKLLQDNAPAHRSAVMKSYLEEFHIQVLPHPPYIPDLSPGVFWLHPYIKSCLWGCKFETRSAVGRKLYQCINSIPKEQFKNAFFQMDFPSREMCLGQWRVLWRSQLVNTAKVSHIFKAQLLPLLKKCPLY